jgi:hypothetical protein
MLPKQFLGIDQRVRPLLLHTLHSGLRWGYCLAAALIGFTLAGADILTPSAALSLYSFTLLLSLASPYQR